MEAVEGLKFSTAPNQNSALSFSESPSPAFGLGTHALSNNLIKTGKEMDDHFKETRYWTYPGKLSSDATIGKYTNLPRGGRVEQMHKIWISILESNIGSKDKSEILYFHRSPGIGKTYI